MLWRGENIEFKSKVLDMLATSSLSSGTMTSSKKVHLESWTWLAWLVWCQVTLQGFGKQQNLARQQTSVLPYLMVPDSLAVFLWRAVYRCMMFQALFAWVTLIQKLTYWRGSCRRFSDASALERPVFIPQRSLISCPCLATALGLWI